MTREKLIVFLAEDARHSDLSEWRERLGVTSTRLESLNIELWDIGGVAERRDVDLRLSIAQMRSSGLVELAARDSKVTLSERSYAYPNDPGFREEDTWGDKSYDQWGLINVGEKKYWDQGPYRRAKFDADIDAPEAWQYVDSLPGEPSETIVAIFDTGIDWLHPDLTANMWTNKREIAGNRVDDDKNGYVDDIYGYDFLNHASDPMDKSSSGHGTHVAGIIGATPKEALGNRGMSAL